MLVVGACSPQENELEKDVCVAQHSRVVCCSAGSSGASGLGASPVCESESMECTEPMSTSGGWGSSAAGAPTPEHEKIRLETASPATAGCVAEASELPASARCCGCWLLAGWLACRRHMLSSKRRSARALRCTEDAAPDCSTSIVGGVATLAGSERDAVASGGFPARRRLRNQRPARAISTKETRTTNGSWKTSNPSASTLAAGVAQVASGRVWSLAPSKASHESIGDASSGKELLGDAHTVPGSQVGSKGAGISSSDVIVKCSGRRELTTRLRRRRGVASGP